MRRLFWKIFVISAWILIQAYLFWSKFHEILEAPRLRTARGILGVTLALSRASALVINFNSAIIAVCYCRITLTWIRSTKFAQMLGLPLDDFSGLHRLSGYSIGMFSLLHSISHYINYHKYSKHTNLNIWPLLFIHGTGLSGHVLLLIMILIIATASFAIVRKKRYELFYYIHKLFYLYFIFLAIHGIFCFVKTDDPAKPCIKSQSWLWISPGFALYVIETIYCFYRSRRFAYVSKVVLHQTNVFEVQIRKPSFSFLPGQYLQLNIPSVSRFQWHPFTITSAPEDDFISVHIRVVGDWTRSTAECFGISVNKATGYLESAINPPAIMPKIRVDGPYGAPCQNFSDYEVVVCIGAGIGQTPFCSVMRSLWYNVVHPAEDVVIKKIIYVGICRSLSAFEWFHDVLRALEDQDTGRMLDIQYYLTGALQPDQVHDIMHLKRSTPRDPITGLKSLTYFGRPRFDPIIRELKEKYYLCRIGVFYCGPDKLADQIQKYCRKYSDLVTNIDFHKEHFEQ